MFLSSILIGGNFNLRNSNTLKLHVMYTTLFSPFLPLLLHSSPPFTSHAGSENRQAKPAPQNEYEVQDAAPPKTTPSSTNPAGEAADEV